MDKFNLICSFFLAIFKNILFCFLGCSSHRGVYLQVNSKHVTIIFFCFKSKVERERERERVNVIFLIFFRKCIWEIRTDNPSLAVEILNGTPRPNMPSQKGLVRNSQ